MEEFFERSRRPRERTLSFGIMSPAVLQSRTVAYDTVQSGQEAYRREGMEFITPVQLSDAGPISSAAPFKQAIRNASYNLNGSKRDLYFFPRGGALPKVRGAVGDDIDPREDGQHNKPQGVDKSTGTDHRGPRGGGGGDDDDDDGGNGPASDSMALAILEKKPVLTIAEQIEVARKKLIDEEWEDVGRSAGTEAKNLAIAGALKGAELGKTGGVQGLAVGATAGAALGGLAGAVKGTLESGLRGLGERVKFEWKVGVFGGGINTEEDLERAVLDSTGGRHTEAIAHEHDANGNPLYKSITDAVGVSQSRAARVAGVDKAESGKITEIDEGGASSSMGSAKRRASHIDDGASHTQIEWPELVTNDDHLYDEHSAINNRELTVPPIREKKTPHSKVTVGKKEVVTPAKELENTETVTQSNTNETVKAIVGGANNGNGNGSSTAVAYSNRPSTFGKNSGAASDSDNNNSGTAADVSLRMVSEIIKVANTSTNQKPLVWDKKGNPASKKPTSGTGSNAAAASAARAAAVEKRLANAKPYQEANVPIIQNVGLGTVNPNVTASATLPLTPDVISDAQNRLGMRAAYDKSLELETTSVPPQTTLARIVRGEKHATGLLANSAARKLRDEKYAKLQKDNTSKKADIDKENARDRKNNTKNIKKFDKEQEEKLKIFSDEAKEEAIKKRDVVLARAHEKFEKMEKLNKAEKEALLKEEAEEVVREAEARMADVEERRKRADEHTLKFERELIDDRRKLRDEDWALLNGQIALREETMEDFIPEPIPEVDMEDNFKTPKVKIEKLPSTKTDNELKAVIKELKSALKVVTKASTSTAEQTPKLPKTPKVKQVKIKDTPMEDSFHKEPSPKEPTPKAPSPKEPTPKTPTVKASTSKASTSKASTSKASTSKAPVEKKSPPPINNTAETSAVIKAVTKAVEGAVKSTVPLFVQGGRRPVALTRKFAEQRAVNPKAKKSRKKNPDDEK